MRSMITVAAAVTMWSVAAAQTSDPGLACNVRAADRSVEVSESGRPVLRYHHGVTQVPDGVDPAFERGDYVSALYGLDGALLTDDFPADHVHHRGVNWSWATVVWNGEMRDMFAVRNPFEGDPVIGGLWQRPDGPTRCAVEPGRACIDADSLWMWDDETPIVAESVRIAIGAETEDRRNIDFTITLTPLEDGVELAGRLEAGYSGFNLRMAPAPGQRICLHTDPPDASPRRAYGNYTAQFAGDETRSGAAVLQHPDNPRYPSEWREYPPLNFFQPAYPGGELIPMPQGETITLRYRIVVHRGELTDAELAALWDAYAAEAERN